MKRLTIITLLLLLLSLPAMARQIYLVPGVDAWSIDLIDGDPTHTVLKMSLNSFTMEDVLIDGQIWSTIQLENRALWHEVGLPALPTIRESIQIPNDSEMALRIVDAEYRDFSNIDVAPSKGTLSRNIDPAMVAYSFDEFYAGDRWFPTAVADLDSPYIMRDTRGVVVELNPFRYNPATRTLRVYTSMTVEIDAVGPGKVNVLSQSPAMRVDEFEKIYAHHFLNYDGDPDRYVSIPEVGSMLVITYDAFHGAVQPLVDWKNQMGIPTTIVDLSAIGSSGTQIKAYIQNIYDTTGVTFILLIGDVAQVPYYNNGGASDPSYGFLAGSDYYPEAFVGRLSAENVTQVATQVERTIEYERDAMAGADWYAKGMGVASAEGAGNGDDGEADYVHMGYIRDDLLGFTYTQVDEVYDTNGGSSTDVANGCNDGRSVINYCGHGSLTSWSTTGFSNTHVNALTNDNLLPFIISVACNNGEFQSGTCFGEAWLRASNSGEPTGAVGFYGSTISMSWAPPMCAQDEMVDLLVAGAKRTTGALCINGSCQMIDEYGSQGENEMKFWTIFGDPSLRVRTATPTASTVSHIPTIDPLMDTFTVDTEPGNLAAISYNGELIGSAFADAAGEAVIPISGLPTPGVEVTLTVSGFNRLTHMGQILVGDGLYPTCDVDPGSFTKMLLVDQVSTDWLHISNNGEDGSTLYYDIEMIDPNYPGGAGKARDIAGSTLEVDLDQYLPGTTVDVVFTATCVSPDNEWIKSVEFDLPTGVNLNSATDMVGGSGGDMPYNNVTGDGANGAWIGTGTWGNIYPNESADATVSLTFGGISGDVVIPYTLHGDIYGGDPHDVSGELLITMAGPNVSVLSPNGGETVAVGQNLSIQFIAAGGPTNVDIELNRGGGWEILVSGLSATFGTYDWTVTGPISADCLIRISDSADPAVSDTSDAPFTIYRQLTWVQLGSLEGTVAQGGTDDILVTFDATGLPDGVYEASIIISSNAGDDVIVPVTVTVVFDPTGVETPMAALSLSQNHPNPFNPTTTINFSLPTAGPVDLKVFDVTGREVVTLLSGDQAAGTHHVVWNGRDGAGQALSSGLYFYRLNADGQTLNNKMLLLK